VAAAAAESQPRTFSELAAQAGALVRPLFIQVALVEQQVEVQAVRGQQAARARIALPRLALAAAAAAHQQPQATQEQAAQAELPVLAAAAAAQGAMQPTTAALEEWAAPAW
jgi:hypothetical protein